jgi:hypothetical protein
LRRLTGCLIIGAIVATAVATHAAPIVNDSWTDGGRDNGPDPLDSNWWTSSSASGIEVAAGSLGMVTGTTGRGIHTVFPTQTLANIGDSLVATYTFRTPATVGTGGTNGFRVGLFDTLDRAELDATVNASSGSPNAVYGWGTGTGGPGTAGLPGYMFDMDVGTGTENLNFREHDAGTVNPTGRMLGTTTGFTNLTPGGPAGAYTFAPDTTYTGSFTLKRTSASEMQLTGTMGTATHSLTDAFDSDKVGLLAFWSNSNLFGSSNAPGDPDNGIDFSNVTIEFLPAASGGEKSWGVDEDGAVSVGANWIGGVAPTSPGDAVAFARPLPANRTVQVDVPLSLVRMRFDNNTNYTITGPQTITLAAPSPDAAAILVENVDGNGRHTISAPLVVASDLLIGQDSSLPLTIGGALDNSAGRMIITSGVGAVVIAGAQTHGAGASLVVEDGTLTLGANAGTNAARNLTLDANSTTNLASTQHLAALNVGAGATVTITAGGPKNLVTGALSIAGGGAPTGKLDLTNNSAIIDYAGTSPAPAVRGQILAGRGAAGLGATWAGMGITSSAAAAAVAAEPESRSIGYAENAAMPLGALTTFRGQSVDDSSILIAFTRTGDANLDGLVNDDDVTIVGATYAPGVPQPAWALGDFDYNRFVDDDDVTLLGVFYDPTAAPLIVPLAGPGADAIASGRSAVPEPSAVLLLAMGTMSVALLQIHSGRRQSPAEPGAKKLRCGDA